VIDQRRRVHGRDRARDRAMTALDRGFVRARARWYMRDGLRGHRVRAWGASGDAEYARDALLMGFGDAEYVRATPVSDGTTTTDGRHMRASASAPRKVRVLVVGESGAGKTAVSRLIARDERASTATEYGGIARTAGCRPEVVLVERGRETMGSEEEGETDAYFVELWDVGGHRQYERERGVFYDQINGVIIVHDASSRSSGARCEAWAREVASKGTFSAPTPTPRERFASAESSCVLYGFGGLPVPCLIIANKIDLEDNEGASSGGLSGLIRRLWSAFGAERRRRFVLPETVGDAASARYPFHHRRTSSFSASALAKLPPGGGLRTSATLGRVDLDVVRSFFRELVERRYGATVEDSNAQLAGAPFVSERLLSSLRAEEDYDDLR